MYKNGNKATVERYNGVNEKLNEVWNIDLDGPIWIVNGLYGRIPVLARTKSEALARYEEEYSRLYKKYSSTLQN